MQCFYIDEFTDSHVCMQCSTEEEAKTFLAFLDSVGRRWCNDESYTVQFLSSPTSPSRHPLMTKNWMSTSSVLTTSSRYFLSVGEEVSYATIQH